MVSRTRFRSIVARRRLSGIERQREASSPRRIRSPGHVAGRGRGLPVRVGRSLRRLAVAVDQVGLALTDHCY